LDEAISEVLIASAHEEQTLIEKPEEKLCGDDDDAPAKSTKPGEDACKEDKVCGDKEERPSTKLSQKTEKAAVETRPTGEPKADVKSPRRRSSDSRRGRDTGTDNNERRRKSPKVQRDHDRRGSHQDRRGGRSFPRRKHEITTRTVQVTNFVRPFTLKMARAMVAEAAGGEEQIESFWMDSIKTHCFVTFKTTAQAVAVLAAVKGKKWPKLGGRCLSAFYSEETAAEVTQRWAEREQHKEDMKKEQQQESELRRELLRSQNQKRRRLEEEDRKKKLKRDVLTLDDLFRKTSTLPSLYFLPLCENEVAKKKALKKRSRT